MQMSITYTKGHETKKANYLKTNTIHETKETNHTMVRTNTNSGAYSLVIHCHFENVIISMSYNWFALLGNPQGVLEG